MINYWLLLLVMPAALSKKMSREACEPLHPDNQPERKKSEQGGKGKGWKEGRREEGREEKREEGRKEGGWGWEVVLGVIRLCFLAGV